MADEFDKRRRLDDTTLRDWHGFQVRPEVAQLHVKYAPLWASEEAERSERWGSFLEHLREDLLASGATLHTHEHGGAEGATPSGTPRTTAEDCQLLERALSQYAAGTSAAAAGADATPRTAALLQQMRSLVQAGVPMAKRGEFWQVFLQIRAKRQPGVYQELVAAAFAEASPPMATPGHGQEQAAAGAAAASSEKPGAPYIQLVADSSTWQCDTGSECEVFRVTPLSIDSEEEEEGEGEVQSGETGAGQGSPPPATPGYPIGSGPSGAEPPSATPASSMQPFATPASALAQPPSSSTASGASPAGCPSSAAASSSSSSIGGSASGSDWSAELWAAKDYLGQIRKDLHRTFPGHPLMDANGREMLCRILAAYARRNPAVGYCQGLNFIAATFLLFMEEEEAFWCLAAVVEDLVEGYFDARMVQPQVDQQVFTHLLQGGFPSVWQHLQQLEVDVGSVTMSWFLCLFVNSLPVETCLRVWDVLFFEGSAVVLFRVALALIDIFDQALVEVRDSSDAFCLLQSMAAMTFDSSRLLDTACIGYGHVRDSALQVLRAKYRPDVCAAMKDAFSCDAEYEFYMNQHPSARGVSTLSRSQLFADAYSRWASTVAGAAASSSGAASSRSPADSGHLTAGSGINSSSASPESAVGGSSSSRQSSPLSSMEQVGGQVVRAAKKAANAAKALRARLVPSALPQLLPSGVLDANGRELEAPPAASLGTRHATDSRILHQQQPSISISPDADISSVRASSEGGSPPQELRISTSRGMPAAPDSPSQHLTASATAGAALARQRAALTPFSDGDALLEAAAAAADMAQQAEPQQEATPPRGQPPRPPLRAAAAVPLHPRSPGAPGQQLLPKGQVGQQRGGRHRRAVSELPLLALAELHGAGEAQGRGAGQRRRPAIDLVKLAQYVPDLANPALATAVHIASKPSPKQPPSRASSSTGGSRQRRSSRTLLSLASTPVSAGSVGCIGCDAAPEAAAAAVGELALKELLPIKALFREDDSGGEDAGSSQQPGTAPACCSSSFSRLLLPEDQPVRRFTDGDAATPASGASSAHGLPAQPSHGDVEQQPSGDGGNLDAANKEQAALVGLLRHIASSPAASPASAAAAAALASASRTCASPVQLGSAGVLSPTGTPTLLTPGGGEQLQQLLMVVELLQQEVATAESQRHAAELAAEAAQQMAALLAQQLQKVQAGLAAKEAAATELQQRLDAASQALATMAARETATSEEAAQLQQRVAQQRAALAQQERHVRLLMEKAGALKRAAAAGATAP